MRKKTIIKPDSPNYGKKLLVFEHYTATRISAAKKKPVNHEKNRPHLSEQNTYAGNITKGLQTYINASNDELSVNASYYAYNGWVYLGGSPPDDRKIYLDSKTQYTKFYSEDFKPNFYQKFPRKKINANPSSILAHLAQASLLPGKQEEIRYFRQILNQTDKKKGTVGQSLPYSWEAHHVLPMSGFIDFFTQEELTIIRVSDYDINDGRNIIFLPLEPADTAVHTLPYHCSDHVKYTKKVKGEFKKIRKAINEEKSNNQPHDAIATRVEQELRGMETKLFKYIKDFGMTRLC